MVRYKFVIPTLYFFSTLSLFPEESNFSDVLQKTAEKKAILAPAKDKESRFIFKDTSTSKGIGPNNENTQKKESEKYVYENKSRFKFQFTSSTGYNNMVSGKGKNSAFSGNLGAGQGVKSHR